MLTLPLLVASVLAGQVPDIGELPVRALPAASSAAPSPLGEIAIVAFEWPGVEPVLADPVPLPQPRLPQPLGFDDLQRLPIIAEEVPWLEEPTTPLTVGQQVGADYRNFYSSSRLGQNAVVFGLAASLAFTNGDEWLRREWQQDVRSPFTDSWSNSVRWMGEWTIMAPVSFGAWSLAELLPVREQEGLWREWGRRTARSYLVGCPAMLAMQWVTGGSRPGESEHGSAWHPFTDANGVSGHAFTGAVPFMAAAQMTDDWRLKSVLYISSTFTGLSRFNDDKHYASQVFLGLWIAHVATQSVAETQVGHYRVLLAPTPIGDGYGLALLGTW